MKIKKLLKEYPQQNSSNESGANNLADLGFAQFDVVIAKRINVLLVGRSGVGKSSIVSSLLFPFHGGIKSGFSDTKLPHCYSLVLVGRNQLSKDNLHQFQDDIDFNESKIDQLEKLKYSHECYQLNIVDTPGLSEIDSEGKEKAHTDEQIINIIDRCLKLDVTGFNLICYVSEFGKTQQMDVDIFKKLQSFFGTEFTEISLMLITHGDNCDPQDQQRIKEEIINHLKSKDVAIYCKLGIQFCGSLCASEITSIQNPATRDSCVLDKLVRITEMRKHLLELFIKHSGSEKMLTHKIFTGLVEQHTSAKMKLVKQAENTRKGFWK